MSREDLQKQLEECRAQNEKFEALHAVGLRPNNAFKEWADEVEHDLKDGLISEKVIEIIAHNISRLDLLNLSSTYYDWTRKEELEKYEGDRIDVMLKCEDILHSYHLFKSIGFADRNTVIVGANGSGKTTLANNLKKALNVEDGIVIPAQKLLVVPTFSNIPTIKSERSPFAEYQKKIFDDKQTYSSDKPDDFPYALAKESSLEYRRVLALLIAERNAKRNEFLDNKAEGSAFYRKEIRTTIDVVMEIWNDLIPHRKMALDLDSNLIISYIAVRRNFTKALAAFHTLPPGQ